MKRFIKEKLNNKGDTLVLALVLIMFLMILGSAVVTASLTNLALKKSENASKKTFYTAESALDEIYVGLGQDSMTAFSDAYETVLATLVSGSASSRAIEILNNSQANTEFKKVFISNALSALAGVTMDSENLTDFTYTSTGAYSQVITTVTAKLESYLENTTAAKITDISAVSLDASEYEITFKDVEVQYINSEDYLATITVDIIVGFPSDLTAYFTADTENTAFEEYGLIAGKNINLGTDSSAIPSKTIAVISNILAGSNINVLGGFSTTFSGLSNIVCGNEFLIKGSAKGDTSATVSGANIWAYNITLDTADDDSNASLTVTDSELYVKDDLELNGRGSVATISGDYYGYSYQGESGETASNSSAIIVNGKKSTLTLTLGTLLVGGHAYINIDNDSEYMTGEALSIKGNQELYFIDTDYLMGYSNPMTITDYRTLRDELTTEDFADFFAYSLLDTETPYVAVADDGLYYLYYNFSTKANATLYFRAIIDDTYFAKVCPNPTSAQTSERASLKRIIQSNLAASSDYVTLNASTANIYSTGALFTMSTATSYSDIVGTGTASSSFVTTLGDYSGYDTLVLSSINYSNRYKLLQYLCMDISPTYGDNELIVTSLNDSYVYNETTGLFELSDSSDNLAVTVDESAISTTTTAAANTINFELVAENPTAPTIVEGSDGTKYIIAAVDGSVDLASYDSTITKGIILATGDVTVTRDFSGTIICLGSITVSASEAGSSVIIGSLNTHEIPGYEALLKYFYAYDTANEGMSDTTYADFVTVNNWRKNEN